MTLLEIFVAFIILYLLRFVIVKFNIKNVIRLTYFVLIFVALRFTLNFRANQIDEVLVHQYFKDEVISIKNNNNVQFIMHENVNPEKIEQYIIQPYLTSRRTKDFQLKYIRKTVDYIICLLYTSRCV